MSYNSIPVLDTDFDNLSINYSASPAPATQRPQLFPHCDCVKANVAFGRKLDKNGQMTEPSMVPVEASAKGHCVHCGYQTRLQSREANLTKSFKPTFGEVIGVCVATGNEVRFVSENQARLAGYYGVKASIVTGAVRSGHIWRRG